MGCLMSATHLYFIRVLERLQNQVEMFRLTNSNICRNYLKGNFFSQEKQFKTNTHFLKDNVNVIMYHTEEVS